MSLTIFPQSLPPGFNLKTYPIVPPSKEVFSGSGMNTNLTNAGVKVNLSNLEVIKIVPEGETDGGDNISSDGSLMKGKTTL